MIKGLQNFKKNNRKELTALLLHHTLFRGKPVPFVMELPNYRLPAARNVVHLLWDKAKDFLQRAFTVIFVASIAVWFLQTFDFRLNVVANSQDSMLAVIAGVIAPVFSPIGLGDWRICTSFISGAASAFAFSSSACFTASS